MKIHTNSYKNNVKLFGREIDSKIIYTLNGETIELGKSELNSVSPHFRSDILKSTMKQLDIDSNVEIPLNTILSYQFGVKIDDSYEYLNYGNYVVYKVEKQEDTRSYKITCYDKMLYSMVDYESMNITYPITIKNYIDAICTHLGLTFKNASDEFVNYDKVIQNELYLDNEGNSLGYTFRDVFDELAQVTASTICINENDDELEIRYITNTGDTIDETFFKDINVNFGEKYGPVNSIVLSRAESDNVYLRDEDSVTQNGLCEIKITDNQIMNFNDRSDYLPAILNKLDGLEYYLNDFSSTGITFYEICDRYNVEIFGNTYSCVMFNDEINITQGLEENVYTELPEQSETDYTKVDKTDRKINQAYIMIDKQNQKIQLLVNKVIDVSNIITGNGQVQLKNAYEGTLHRLEIKGNISCLFASNDIKVSNDLTPNDTYLIVDDENRYKLDFTYLNYTNENIHDTYVYEDGKQWVERSDGTIEKSDKEILIKVKNNSVLKMESFENVQITAIYLLENEYTNNFTTSVDLIAQINLSPGLAEIDAHKISLRGKNIDLTSDNIVINSKYFNVDAEGNLTATSATLSGSLKNYSNNNLAIELKGTNINMYDWRGSGNIAGSLSSVATSRVAKKTITDNGEIINVNENYSKGICLYTYQNSTVSLGYKDSENSEEIHNVISFDTNNPTDTPFIINTASGNLFKPTVSGYDYEGITVQNGLIKEWGRMGWTGTVGKNAQVGFVISNGLIMGITY